MSGEKRHRIMARHQPIHKISIHDLRAMYAVFASYYDNVSLEQFIEDMSDKTGVLVLRDETDQRIVGFSTLISMQLRMGGCSATGVFSGGTILERAYWGNRSLQIAFYGHLVQERFRRLFSPVFWLLISKGYRTHLLLANNFTRYDPDPGDRFDWLEPYVDTCCRALFPEAYCSQRKIWDSGQGSPHLPHLKGEVTPITGKMRERQPKIRFFGRRNPGWQRGTELPCLGVMGYVDVVRLPLLLVGQAPASRGRAKSGGAL